MYFLYLRECSSKASTITDVINDVIYDVGMIHCVYMGRRELEDRNIRKISKSGNGSYYITIPIGNIRELGWRERQKVTVKKSGERLVIEDWKE